MKNKMKEQTKIYMKTKIFQMLIILGLSSFLANYGNAAEYRESDTSCRSLKQSGCGTASATV